MYIYIYIYIYIERERERERAGEYTSNKQDIINIHHGRSSRSLGYTRTSPTASARPEIMHERRREAAYIML